MIVASLYARVSSEKQAQENTILSQVEALETRINADGYKLIDEYKFIDNGYSGSNLARPALEQLRDKVSEGKVDKIYIHSPDRLSRKYAYQMLLLEEFQKANVEIIFLNCQTNNSPESHLLLQMQGMIAEYERTKIMERNRRGKIHGAKRGNITTLSAAPYGYKYITKHEGGGQALYEINIEAAEVIKKIFSWISKDRLSIGEVCRRLKGMNIQSPKGKSYWNKGSIWAMLQNPAYKGQAAFGRRKSVTRIKSLRPAKNSCEQPKQNYSVIHTGKENWIYMSVPAIIDEDTFDAVQEQLEENRKTARARSRGAMYLLQGLIVCQCCHYAYYGKPVIKEKGDKIHHYTYYRCAGTDSNHFGGNKICNNNQIRADILETAIWEEVKHLLKNPHRILEEYQRRILNLEKSPLDHTKDSLKNQANKLKKGIERLIDSYAQQYIDKTEFEPRIKTMKQHLQMIEEQNKNITDQENLKKDLTLIVTNLEEFTASIEKNLDHIDVDWNTKRDIIRMLIKRIEINKEDVKVVFRIQDMPKLENIDNYSKNTQSLQHCRRGLNFVSQQNKSIMPNPLLVSQVNLLW